MKTLETKNLILRKFKINDYKDMYNNWASNEDVAKMAGFPVHKNSDVTKDLVKFWIEEYKEENVFNWVIELKSTGEIIGSITVVNKDLKNKVCEIGYNIGPNWWNKGYTTECLKVVLNYIFELDIFDVVTANCHSYNIASSRVLEKCGFKKEGILRSRKIIDNEKIDLIQYSILKIENNNKD